MVTRGRVGVAALGSNCLWESPITAQEIVPWANQDSSAVLAAPSLERCVTLDRMQLLTKPLV